MTVKPASAYTVDQHFEKCDPAVKAAYEAIMKSASKLGPVITDPKKTSIHLVRSTAFAGIATRKTALILTLKSDSDLRSDRIFKRERTSANRWHLEIRIENPGQVDRELAGWIKKAYSLAE